MPRPRVAKLQQFGAIPKTTTARALTDPFDRRNVSKMQSKLTKAKFLLGCGAQVMSHRSMYLALYISPAHKTQENTTTGLNLANPVQLMWCKFTKSSIPYHTVPMLASHAVSQPHR